MLLPFFRTSWWVGALNSAIFNSFHKRIEFGTILEGLQNFAVGGWKPQPPLGTPLFCAMFYVQQKALICFNSFHNRVEFGTILEGLQNFAGGVENPNPPPRYATVLCHVSRTAKGINLSFTNNWCTSFLWDSKFSGRRPWRMLFKLYFCRAFCLNFSAIKPTDSHPLYIKIKFLVYPYIFRRNSSTFRESPRCIMHRYCNMLREFQILVYKLPEDGIVSALLLEAIEFSKRRKKRGNLQIRGSYRSFVNLPRVNMSLCFSATDSEQCSGYLHGHFTSAAPLPTD